MSMIAQNLRLRCRCHFVFGTCCGTCCARSDLYHSCTLYAPHPPTHHLPPPPNPTGYAMGTRRSRLHNALDRLTPGGRRRRSGTVGSAAGSGALSPAGTGPQAGRHSRPSPGFGPVGSGKLAGSDFEDGPEAPLAVPLNGAVPAASSAGLAANGAAAHGPLVGQLSADGRLLQPRSSTAAAEADQLPPSPFDASASGPVLPPSPFEAPTPKAAAGGASQQAVLRGSAAGSAAVGSGSQRPTAQLPGNGRLMLYQRSMLRLRSSVAGTLRAPGSAAGGGGDAAAGRRHGQRLAALEEGRSAHGDGTEGSAAEDGVPPAEPEHVLEPARSGSPDNTSGKSGSGGGSGAKGGFSWDDKAVRVTSRCACVGRCAVLCCAVL